MVTIAELEQYMFNLINQSRAAGGLVAYTSNATLATVARDHSNLLLKTDPKKGCVNDHQCNAPGEPGEPDPATCVRNAGVTFTQRRENVGYAWEEPTFDPFAGLRTIHYDIFMKEGPGGGHYDAIMSSTLEQVGVGVAFDGNHIWATEDFIKP